MSKNTIFRRRPSFFFYLLFFALTFSCSIWESPEEKRNYEPIAIASYWNEQTITGEDPKAVATIPFPLEEGTESGKRDLKVEYPQTDRAIVTITDTNLPDDSVFGIRYRIELDRLNRDWKVIWAGRQFQCRAGRGDSDWSKKICL